MRYIKQCLLNLLVILFLSEHLNAQIIDMWDKTISNKLQSEKTQWFQDAKFGLFVHWGLFSQAGGEWKEKRFYGVSEWMMQRGKIPVAEYSKLVEDFNPTKFNAEEWVNLAKDAGIKYIVVTAKHHEGFAMFKTNFSNFSIMNTPFKRDPLKELSASCNKKGLKLCFYYSQNLDWHEPNGGGNDWDFVEKNKDYSSYYNTKSIPQITELLSNYGPLGLIWFDMPGGISKEQTQSIISKIKKLQPNCLISSRIGLGLGDFRDFGDGEVPPVPVKEPWEAIFTHNDSWGYSKFDFNFKTVQEIILLLTDVVSKGGNLLLNVGPKGDGSIPEVSVKCLLSVGKWLQVNGDAIYGTTYGPIPPQPWGVSTLKTGKLFLHVLHWPKNSQLIVPGFTGKVSEVKILCNNTPLVWEQNASTMTITLPKEIPDETNTIIEVLLTGPLNESYFDAPIVVSPWYDHCNLDISRARNFGNSKIEHLTSSHYFGDWKHNTCATSMQAPADSISYQLNFSEVGDYKIILEYSCPFENSGQEGLLKFDEQKFYFQTLATGNYDNWHPLLFIQQTVSEVSIKEPGIRKITISPLQNGKELFKLNRVVLTPIHFN